MFRTRMEGKVRGYQKFHFAFQNCACTPSYVNMVTIIMHCHAQVPFHWSQTSYDDMNALKNLFKKNFRVIKLIKLKCVPRKIEISTQVWVQVNKILTWWGKEEEKFIKTKNLCKDFFIAKKKWRSFSKSLKMNQFVCWYVVLLHVETIVLL